MDNIIYPNINENDFIIKLEKIFKNKIEQKYKIKWIKYKTYVDIILELKKLSYFELEKIKMLSNLFNKAKYSTLWINKSELLELVKKI